MSTDNRRDRRPEELHYNTVKTAPKKGGFVSTIYTARKALRHLVEIKDIVQEGTRYAKAHVSIPQALEWLLDNWYIAEREGKCAVEDLKRQGRLPRAGEDGTTLFVLYAAHEYLDTQNDAVDADSLEAFLDAFQNETVLSEAELASMIPAVRIALVERLLYASYDLQEALTGGAAESLADLAGTFARIFTSLRFLSGFDSSDLFERVGRVERALRQDPAGVYPEMDESTRHDYRRTLARLAEKHGISEYEAAEKILALAREKGEHIGVYLYKKNLGAERRAPRGIGYVASVVLISLALSVAAALLFRHPAYFIALFFPLSALVKSSADYIVLKFCPIRRVPRLALEGGVPEEGRTLCVISMLLTSEEGAKRAASLLEEYALANRDAGGNLSFGLLIDLPDSLEAETDADRKYLSFAGEQIEALNARHSGGFFLFYRAKTYSKSSRCHTAWERKRGAILEISRYLRGKNSRIICSAGDVEALHSTRYLITLDGDTRLCAGTARELIGAALHPLNRPVIDEKRKVVLSGCGIIQPRVTVDLAAANQTTFTRVFAGLGGIDPYGATVGDVYQNLVGAGSFTGKGLIDIDAFLTCLDGRFPQDRVLSHDLLEGAHLHCAFAGDIEVTDGFPAKVTSYFDRMHRWTRGDWQSMPWLFPVVKNEEGRRIINPLSPLDKWKIFDNLRRSLVPVSTFVLLIMAIISGSTPLVWAAIVAFGAQIMRLIVLSASSLLRGRRARARYHSTVIHGISGSLAHSALQFVFLPFEAWMSLSAVLTALWRMLVSRRNLLAWVTAADAERRSQGGAVDAFLRMWPALIPCVAAAILSPHMAGTVIAAIWLLSPFAAAQVSKKQKPGVESLRAEDKRFLIRCAGDIWRFFETFLTAEDHFLPPDNYQEQPAVGVAHRTSPTNIGLSLLSCLAAVDLGLCKKDKALSLIAQTLSTVERLPKWNGHLYNWYDTMTLTVLPPAYVSSVDSGNFAGCLIALREGLLEYGAADLAERANVLLKAMSFEPLYDKKRRLFYIGIEVDKNAPTPGWYDLLASEARQTSYIAVSRGEVPKKHWRSLGRALVEKDGYRGMASWTGTMFEYLMPEILLPCYQNSLIYESLKFCLYIQKKQAKSKPWGMSESAFYAYDHTLSYRYKAHGAAGLALKRGMERDVVVSPYSTFLALPIEPRSAIRNLKYLQKLGAEGRYGFFEAVDFTPERMPEDKHYEIVKTYMAHHIGMSLLSIANTLKGGIMQKRFMRDRQIAAFAELLQEKLPVGGIVLKPSPRDVPEKPLRASADRWRYASTTPDYSHPAFTLLGNGAYHVAISETGLNRSVWNGLEIMQCGTDPFSMQAGITFYLRVGEEIIPLQCAPVFRETVRYSAELSGSCCRLVAQSGSIASAVTATVPKDETGEIRTVEIASRISCDAELICYGEPVLSRGADFASHPAFSKLSLQSGVTEGAVVFRRRPRAHGQGYSMAAAVSHPYSFDTSREKALGRGGFNALPSALSREPGSSTGSVLDPCLLIRVPLRLEAGKPERVRFAFTVSQESSAAAESALRLVNRPERGPASHLDKVAEDLSLSHEDIGRALALVPYLLLQPMERTIPEEYVDALALGQSGLWVFGVSGDLPIVACVVENEEGLDETAPTLAMHRLLRENGVPFDLVFILKDAGDYRSTLRDGIVSRLRRQSYEYILGARGGVHTVDASAENVPLLLAAAVKVIRSLDDFSRKSPVTVRPALGNRFFPPAPRHPLQYGYDEENSFVFTVSGALPPNAWCHMLANRHFGFVATDAGTGHLWHINARENKINQWRNDSLATLGTETLSVIVNGQRVSLFAAEDGFPCRVTYGFGWAQWCKSIHGTQITTTAFVPPDISARVLMITASEGHLADVEYYTDLVLAPDAQDAVYTRTQEEGGVITAENRYNRAFSGSQFRLTASHPYDAFTCSQLSYSTGRLEGKTGAGFLPCISAQWRGVEKLVIVTGCDDTETLISLAQHQRASAALTETKRYWKGLTGKLIVSTPYKDLDHFTNGWVLYQTIACRIFGRTSLYQSGGAYGYRDQLQDICAILDEAPDIAREHILRAAAHQFEEGDVQHWWHPSLSGEEPDKGVRTRCSDDLLWLPYALCLYVEKTGDRSVLDETVPYLTSPVLSEGEHERYEQPQQSEKSASVLQHAIDAAIQVIQRGTGLNGLLLIGTGDWNDGMNLVGAGGDGESVWLTWFAIIVFRRLAALCHACGKPGVAATLLEKAEEYIAAAENAWDGAWYKRGYYDNGAPLGSGSCDECQIDSIAQSFAVFAGADREKTKTALKSAVMRLYDSESRVIRLFDPPFSHGGSIPGYIKGYSPGFRENGGQYTHGAIWLAMALLHAGMKEEGLALTQALLPVGRPLEVYRTEPYVIAADVYWAEGHKGRGGWTWYTGAAGWFKRLVVEELLGLTVKNGVLHVKPELPPGFGGYAARWRHNGKTYLITVRDNHDVEVTCDGQPVTDGSVVVYKVSATKA